jgi:hypothetical protein
MTESEQHERALAAMSPRDRAHFDRVVREMRDQKGLTTEAERQQCVYCGATATLEAISPGNGSKACQNTVLCQLRAEGVDPVDLALRLNRALAQQYQAENAERYSVKPPGSPEWARHAQTYRGSLSGQDVARLRLVLRAASGWLSDSWRADSAVNHAQARADLGCRRCGAMGPDEPCLTGDGSPVRGHGRASWHTGRKF